MVEEKFNSINDLYKRVLPALKSKKRELAANKINFVLEQDIWDYLKENKWNKENNLTLFDIVNDILYVDEAKLLEYIKR